MLTHKFNKILCYLVAILNIVLMAMAANVALSGRYKDGDMICPPTLANIILAVLLFIGVATRRPSFIKLFRIFMYLQMIFLLLIAVYLYRLVVHGRYELREVAHGACMLTALFGLESVIATAGLKAVLSELPRQDEGVVAFQPLV